MRPYGDGYSTPIEHDEPETCDTESCCSTHFEPYKIQVKDESGRRIIQMNLCDSCYNELEPCSVCGQLMELEAGIGENGVTFCVKCAIILEKLMEIKNES